MELLNYHMQRNDILNQLMELQAEVELALSQNDQATVNSLMQDQVEKEFWPQLLNLSQSIFDNLDKGTAAFQNEYKYQKKIRDFVTRIRFIAG